MNQIINEKQGQSGLYQDRQKDYWATFDLGCSSALVSLKFSLVSIDKQNLQKARFVFTASEELAQAVNNYFSDRLLVNPRSFFDNTKMLKSRIYS